MTTSNARPALRRTTTTPTRRLAAVTPRDHPPANSSPSRSQNARLQHLSRYLLPLGHHHQLSTELRQANSYLATIPPGRPRGLRARQCAQWFIARYEGIWEMLPGVTCPDVQRALMTALREKGSWSSFVIALQMLVRQQATPIRVETVYAGEGEALDLVETVIHTDYVDPEGSYNCYREYAADLLLGDSPHYRTALYWREDDTLQEFLAGATRAWVQAHAIMRRASSGRSGPRRTRAIRRPLNVAQLVDLWAKRSAWLGTTEAFILAVVAGEIPIKGWERRRPKYATVRSRLKDIRWLKPRDDVPATLEEYLAQLDAADNVFDLDIPF